MKSLLLKLSLEEIETLSSEINKNQKIFFGNSLSSKEQEDFMAKLFNVENWSTLLRLYQTRINTPEMVQYCGYDEHIRILLKSDEYLDDPEHNLDQIQCKNSELSSYFWDKGFEEAIAQVKHFEKENTKLLEEITKLKKEISEANK